jgi:hypothetical protein
MPSIHHSYTTLQQVGTVGRIYRVALRSRNAATFLTAAQRCYYYTDMRERLGQMWLSLIIVAIAVAGGGSAAISQSPPPTPQGGCSGDACLALATKLEQKHDYLGARDTLRAGCETGSVDACIRLAMGDAYLLNRDDVAAILWKACQLGDFTSCGLACTVGRGNTFFVEESRKWRRACPDPRANLHACQKLEEFPFSPPDTARSCRDLEPGFDDVDPHNYQCPYAGSLERCEFRAGLRAFFTGSSSYAQAKLKEVLVTLCKRGSASACIQGADNARRDCASEPCAFRPEDEGEVYLVEKTEQLCKDGVMNACLLLGRGGSPREMKKLCEQGHKAVCKHLIDSADPLAGEAACRQGDVDSCDAIIERIRGNAAKLSAFFARMCAADFASCLAPRWNPVQSGMPTVWQEPQELIVRSRETTCSAVVLHARALAGIRKPKTDPKAERLCQSRLSSAARSCIMAATDRSAIAGCTRARTSSEVVREEAMRLAEAAGSYFEGEGRIPAAPPFPKGPPCCGANCRPPTGGARDPDPVDPAWQRYGIARWPRWVQRDLKSTDRDLIASASGDWNCDGTAEAYEARWRLIDGKVSRITVTARPQ